MDTGPEHLGQQTITRTDNDTVLTFWQAQDKAKTIVRGQAGGERTSHVAEALENYEADLKSRGGAAENASRVLACIPTTLAAKSVSLLGARSCATGATE